jgi:nicotinate dehydrogenase subunit B
MDPIDELATEAGVDPVEYRLRYLKDQRAVDLDHAVAVRAGWVPRPARQEPEAEGDIVRGRGFAYALYVHSKFPGYGAAWSAWIADVAVNKATGDVSVTRVVTGQDSGLMINPDGVRHQIHGNVIQSTSRALMEQVSFDRNAVTAREWGAYPIIKFPDVPKIDVLMLPRQDQPPLGRNPRLCRAPPSPTPFMMRPERFRELPFTPERILRGCAARAAHQPRRRSAPQPDSADGRSVTGGAAFCHGRGRARLVGIGAAVLPWRAIAPIARPDASVYSQATIARGQQLAALGDCAVCHTGERRSMPAAGPKPRTAPSTTNITPDVETALAPGPILP